MIPRYKIPDWVLYNNFVYEDLASVDKKHIERIKEGLEKFKTTDPQVSIIIPTYNEEKGILHTLSSISQLSTSYKAELIIINNNSTDNTQAILEACGVKSIFEPRQGTSFARQTGLEQAKGKYILNADADSIYPKEWVNAYVQALQDKSVSCAYGTYSFLPEYNSRFVLANYELISQFIIGFRKYQKEFLNVLGFNFAFRKEDAEKVGGFNINRARWQDGWMAMKLMEVGKLKQIKGQEARVWTSDRRLMYDGGIVKAVAKRLKKEVVRYLPQKV